MEDHLVWLTLNPANLMFLLLDHFQSLIRPSGAVMLVFEMEI